ncbi:hypothetical protein BV20DRAFT_1116598 [Pilatotrama ljubarskyi]|nr:hypothetical protein BV20DRAFT_1116598 [Pilatotrama ljubarskyi]
MFSDTPFPLAVAAFFLFTVMLNLVRLAVWPEKRLRRLSEDVNAADSALAVLIEEGRLADKVAEELCSRLLQLNARLEDLRTFYAVQTIRGKAARYFQRPPYRALQVLSAEMQKLQAEIQTHRDQAETSQPALLAGGTVFSRWV